MAGEHWIVKAVGVHSGRGAIIANTGEELLNAVRDLCIDRVAGAVGDMVTIETVRPLIDPQQSDDLLERRPN